MNEYAWCSACNVANSWHAYLGAESLPNLFHHIQTFHAKGSPRILDRKAASPSSKITPPQPSLEHEMEAKSVEELPNHKIPVTVFENYDKDCSSNKNAFYRKARFPNGIVSDPKNSHNSSLVWDSCPKSVLLVHKLGDSKAFAMLREVARYLCSCSVDSIFLCSDVFDEILGSSLEEEKCKLKALDEDADTASIDIAVCLGGDGTLLFVNALLQNDLNPFPVVPPIVSFSLGSLGFLTNFDANDYQNVLSKLFTVEQHPVSIVLRDRLRIRIIRATGECEKEFHALNEVVIDRGLSSYLCSFEMFVNDELVTIIQADGIIISTATGSTAYSLSAGGPMVPPSVSAMVMTPICPHTLSFRPTVLPDSSCVKIKVPETMGETLAFASMDGQNGIVLKSGDYVEVRMSRFPFPCVCSQNSTSDWFRSIKSRLFWNLRRPQKPRRSLTQHEFDEFELGSLDSEPKE